MKSHEYTPDIKENIEQPVNEISPWDSLAKVSFTGDDEDENLDRIKKSMVPDETVTKREQQAMEEAQAEADKNESIKSADGKELEDYIDNILSREE